MRWSSVLAASVWIALGVETRAASPGNWPCVQRKVAEISLAAIWTGPQPNAEALRWRSDSAIADLVLRLSARRTTDIEARRAIAELATTAGATKQEKLMSLVQGLLETINAERAAVIGGLERFGKAQKDMADALRKQNSELSELRNEPQADPAKLAQQTEQLQWTLRIFEERQKSLRYVCDVPGLLEQRLFALAKEIGKNFQASN